MNLNSFLLSVLDIAKYPDDKRLKFIEEFYQYYFSKVIDGIGSVDASYGQRLLYAVDHSATNPQGLNDIWDQLLKDDIFKKKIEEVTDTVIGELVTDISQNATEEQKRKIGQLVGGEVIAGG